LTEMLCNLPKTFQATATTVPLVP